MTYDGSFRFAAMVDDGPRPLGAAGGDVRGGLVEEEGAR